MKKAVTAVIGGVAVLASASYIFRAQLMEAAKDKITEGMFIAADTDNYDRGLAIGSTFPSIEALYQGETVESARPFVADKGMVFIANRSADW